MYEVAYKEKIKYVFNGHSFRTEGIEPLDWTYMDGLYVKDINKKFGKSSLDKFDNFELKDLIKYNFINGIQTILPLNYIEYNQEKVIKILQENFDWINYGGHHHESLLTKFVVSYYLPKKFGIDRRRTGLSALVRSGQIKREEAIEILNVPSILNDGVELKNYILDKLDISEEDFKLIMSQKNKNFKNFTTYYNFLKILNFLQKFSINLNLYLKFYI